MLCEPLNSKMFNLAHRVIRPLGSQQCLRCGLSSISCQIVQVRQLGLHIRLNLVGCGCYQLFK